MMDGTDDSFLDTRPGTQHPAADGHPHLGHTDAPPAAPWDPASGTPFECSPGALELDAEIAGYLGQLRAGIDGLLGVGDRGDLMALGADRLVDVLQRFEAHRGTLAAVDALLIEAAEEERLPAYVAAPSLPAALVRLVKLQPGAAKARVRQAEQLRARNELSAGTLECPHPVLRDAVRAGELSADQHAVIARAVARLATNTAVDPDDAARAEQTLVRFAASLTPVELAEAARVIDDCLLPDGSLPNEDTMRARRGLRLGEEQRDGTHSISGNLTRELHAKLQALLSPLAAPQPSEDAGQRDTRNLEQRQHDALEDAVDRLLDSDALPRTGGARTTLHVAIDLDQLRAALARLDGATAPNGADRLDRADPEGGPFSGRLLPRVAAGTSLGTRLSIGELLRLAEQAEIIPTFVNAAGGVIAYGRARRFASPAQVKALTGRDKGCSFPGCTIPPEWCEVHHVVEWWRGGRTDVDNLTMICGYHHREFEQCGWRVDMRAGIPVWIPPPWVDRDRTPQINTRITGLQAELVLDALFQQSNSAAEGADGDPALAEVLSRHGPAGADEP
ncbi:HNH endonuclease signature motif containing protein [Cumulibacter manganitolerans]|uniref:HNH endonuclease signature motif containing protein n=1 Tax=Cumulibacter manganitolerans TaxID=1884992 RepID=UPI001E4499CB|nr:HNH endonuclease signature motif containing protein [Cumulibacter manganitolerans]